MQVNTGVLKTDPCGNGKPSNKKTWEDPELFLLSTDDTQNGYSGPSDGVGPYS